MKLKPMKLTQPPIRGKEVEEWQRFLKSKGLYVGSINGIYDAATDAATDKYRQKTYLRGDEVFVLSFDRPDRNHFTTKNSQVVLTGSITTVLSRIAYGYYLLTGRELVVTSGLRSADEQARLMRGKATHGKSALVRLYKSAKLADNIWEAYDNAHKAGAGERGEIEAMATVIRDQVNQREYVSSHLTGRAFDVRTPEDRRAFEQVVQEVLGSIHGHLIEKELHGEPHFHVQFDR